MNASTNNLIKIGLSILFYICLLDMPYGYFMFVRYVAMCGFAYLALHSKRNKNENEMLIYVALAVLFQPIFKISLGRGIWNVIDVIVGTGLLYSIYRERNKSN